MKITKIFKFKMQTNDSTELKCALIEAALQLRSDVVVAVAAVADWVA